jgi:exportin-2 (importin alpha re-exporter)
VFTKGSTGADVDAAVTAIDFEEQASGYQASYSKLAASETVQYDPVAYVADPQRYLAEELSRAKTSNPSIKQFVQMSQPRPEVLQILSNNGLIL